MLPGLPSQVRDAGRDLTGLRGGVPAAVDAATRVESVGTALADLLEKWPGRRGGGRSK